MKGVGLDFVKLIVFNFALSLVIMVWKESSLLTTSKNAVLPWHKVGFLRGVLVVVNLQAFLAMQVIHLGPTLDGVYLVMGEASSPFGFLRADIVVHLTPLQHPLRNVAVSLRAHLENFADLRGEVLELVPK